MRRIRIFALSLIVGLTSFIWSGVPVAAHPLEPAVTYYLSLGDSLAQGVQPVGDNNANARTDEGYPDKLFDRLQESNPGLQLIKLGCPGESTLTMRDPKTAFSDCRQEIYDKFGNAETQLGAAIWFLQHHRGAVKFLTIDLGANDIVGCLQPTGVDQKCLMGGVDQINANLPFVLKTLRDTLRDTGQRKVKTAGMTYYDPGLAYWYFDQHLARDTVGYLTLVNGVLVAKYFQSGFRVAPVAAAFKTYDFSFAPGATVPVNVGQICLLTWMCPPSPASNIHARPKGYQLIADTFAQVLRW